MDKKGLGIIFHSGAYDRIYHGFSIALAALALGRDVRLFFSYWALEYLKKKGPPVFELESGSKMHKEIIEKNMKKGHLQKISDHVAQVKQMGAKVYACTNSMGILNIARDELIAEVDKAMGLTTFLTETKDHQILFV